MGRYRYILFGIVFLLSLFSFFIIYIFDKHIHDSEKFVKDTIMQEAISYFNNIKITKKWNASHGGIYVDNNSSEQKDTNTDESQFVKMNHVLMTRQIAELSNEVDKHYFKTTSLKPVNPLNAPDEFEKRALNYFEKNKNEEYYTEVSPDLSRFNFMGSLKVTNDCLKCHGNDGYELGDIRGGIRVTIPTTKYFEKMTEIKDRGHFIIIIAIIVSVLIIGGFYDFLTRLTKSNREIEENLEEIKKLKESNDKLVSKYEYAIEGSQEGLWDWDLLTNNVNFSKNWKGMLGFAENELEDRLSTWVERVHPDDKEQAIKDIEANQNKETEHYQNIHRLRHKDGSWVWILDRGKTIFDEDGKPIRMLGFHADITELKKLELELKATKNELLEFRFIIESAPLSIVITDINARINYVNPHFCKVSGYTEREILGKNPGILKAKDETDHKKFKDLWKKILNKEPWGGIFRNVRKDGQEYWETATILPILNKKGEIINYLGIMREITKELYLEKELKEKEELMLSQSRNAAMGEMISMIAHQWRQPITAISMSANNIIADIDLEMWDEAEVKKVAENISEQTQYLSKTIDDFRNFFKKEKVTNEFKFKELIDEISSILLASLKNNDIDFVTYSSDEECVLNTYKRELLQVLLNIIKNAKEALSEKEVENKKIVLDLKRVDEQFKIIIKDNAGGITKENLDKIFNAYFTTKDEKNGTGLGLYMSKMIVEKHLNGTLTVRNDDEGAVFEITF